MSLQLARRSLRTKHVPKITSLSSYFPQARTNPTSFRLYALVRSFSTSVALPPNISKTSCGLYVDRDLPPTFSKILIANRGEIACRVIRSARELGIKTVAVYSDADVNALHVQMADEAYRLGEAPATSSYLKMDKILQIAKESGAQAIHPGYGFLSENEGFAKACQAAGVKFIGPPPAAIHAMGSKSASKKIMIDAKVPVVPGYHGEDQSVQTLKQEAEKCGYPIMLKAVHGGGGKGMRIVWNADSFEEALEGCKREARASFGNDRVLLERYITRPRHIEFQVFADQHGNAVHLYERDCSVQRRHQKVLEEAPAPGMDPELRAKMGKSATDAALAVGYEGAGTVEFIFDASTGEYFFMEMNTRLQVEHPVTEMIVRRDLVQWQLHIAAGHPMPVKQDSIQGVGHALEARIYAENPDNQFLPATGRLLHLRPPPPSHDIRVESGVREGDEVSIFYDPMICKLVVWGPDRQQCLTRMSRALDEYQVVGPSNNIPFLRRAVKHPVFQKGQVETGFIAAHIQDLLPKDRDGSKQIPHVALAIINLLLEEELQASRVKQEIDPTSLWFDISSFRPNIDVTRTVSLTSSSSSSDEEKKEFKVLVKQKSPSDSHKRKPASYEFQVGNEKKTINVSGRILHDITQNSRHLIVTVDEQTYQGDVVRHGQSLHVYISGEQYTYNLPEVHYGSAEGGSTSGSGCPAPMAGKVVKVFVKPDDVVKKGASLVVMEAMKMEHTIKAPFEGVISAVHFQQGDFVEGGKILVSFQQPSK